MSFFRKKKEAFEIMNERNRIYLESMKAKGEDPDAEAEYETALEHQKEYQKNNDLGLEKGDTLALILSAFLVFGPVFLIIIAILVVAWIFLH